jgi:hypothetical protein
MVFAPLTATTITLARVSGMAVRERSEPRWGVPRGATGFWDQGSDPLPETDPRAFARICYEVARRIGGRVVKITPPAVTPNFHLATLARPEHRLALLGHRHLPLLAVAESSADNSGSATFVNDPAVREVWSRPRLFGC